MNKRILIVTLLSSQILIFPLVSSAYSEGGDVIFNNFSSTEIHYSRSSQSCTDDSPSSFNVVADDDNGSVEHHFKFRYNDNNGSCLNGSASKHSVEYKIYTGSDNKGAYIGKVQIDQIDDASCGGGGYKLEGHVEDQSDDNLIISTSKGSNDCQLKAVNVKTSD